MDLHRVTWTDVPWREGAGCSRTAKHTPPIRPAGPVCHRASLTVGFPRPNDLSDRRAPCAVERCKFARASRRPDASTVRARPRRVHRIRRIAWWTPTAHAQEDQTPPTLREISTTSTGALIPLSYDENLLD